MNAEPEHEHQWNRPFRTLTLESGTTPEWVQSCRECGEQRLAEPPEPVSEEGGKA